MAGYTDMVRVGGGQDGMEIRPNTMRGRYTQVFFFKESITSYKNIGFQFHLHQNIKKGNLFISVTKQFGSDKLTDKPKNN